MSRVRQIQAGLAGEILDPSFDQRETLDAEPSGFKALHWKSYNDQARNRHRKKRTPKFTPEKVKGFLENVTPSKAAEVYGLSLEEFRVKCEEIGITLPAKKQKLVSKAMLIASIEKIRNQGKPVTITAVSLDLQISQNTIRNAWKEYGFPSPPRGKPKGQKPEDEIAIAIRMRIPDNVIAKKYDRSREAIRQRREKMGLPAVNLEAKVTAYSRLLTGVRPAIVAAETGFALLTVRRWKKEIEEDPLCVAENFACARKATIKADPDHIAPSLCRAHA